MYVYSNGFISDVFRYEIRGIKYPGSRSPEWVVLVEAASMKISRFSRGRRQHNPLGIIAIARVRVK